LNVLRCLACGEMPPPGAQVVIGTVSLQGSLSAGKAES
jgi:hypothetical protein